MTTVQLSLAISERELLAQYFAAGVSAVSGEKAVLRALQQDEAFQADFIIAGGNDGPTDAAGGIIHSRTAMETTAAADALSRADVGTYLRQTGDILITGPGYTNVMDLTIALVS